MQLIPFPKIKYPKKSVQIVASVEHKSIKKIKILEKRKMKMSVVNVLVFMALIMCAADAQSSPYTRCVTECGSGCFEERRMPSCLAQCQRECAKLAPPASEVKDIVG